MWAKPSSCVLHLQWTAFKESQTPHLLPGTFLLIPTPRARCEGDQVAQHTQTQGPAITWGSQGGLICDLQVTKRKKTAFIIHVQVAHLSLDPPAHHYGRRGWERPAVS